MSGNQKYFMMKLLLDREKFKVQRLIQNKIEHSQGKKTNFVSSYPIDTRNPYEVSKAINYELALAELNVNTIERYLKQ